MLPNIFWSRTDYISGAYATKMVAISSPAWPYVFESLSLYIFNYINNLSFTCDSTDEPR